MSEIHVDIQKKPIKPNDKIAYVNSWRGGYSLNVGYAHSLTPKMVRVVDKLGEEPRTIRAPHDILVLDGVK